jgi:hypothetical protein
MRAMLQRSSDVGIRSHADDGTKSGANVTFADAESANPVLARRAACPCGGGCPRCGALRPKSSAFRVSTPADPIERQADRRAEQVMDAPGGSANGSSGAAPTSIATSRDGSANEEAVDVNLALREIDESAAPLPRDIRSSFEGRFGRGFGGVRVHADHRAAAAARAVRARAYTVGQDIVFGANQFAPTTFEGQKLIAHELAHVEQQQRGVPVHVQRAADFGLMYRGKGGKVRSHGQKEYEVYKRGLGETRASSEAGGHAFHEFSPITREELLTVFKGVAKDIAGKVGDDRATLEAIVDSYLAKLNQAFETFKIDTVEAQASYMANAWRESDQFRFMTETQKAVKSNKPYESDPTKVKLNTSWLDKAATGKVVNPDGSVTKVVNYEPGGSINPMTDWQQSFVGRGPIQVTHRHFYVQALAVMENRAEELEKKDTNSQDAKDLREAIDAIKVDPRQAANPKYAFMFSAAFMKMPDDEGVRGDVKATKGQVTSWMGVQPSDAKKDKEKAYAEAVKMLMPKWEEDQAYYERAHSHTPAEMPEGGEGDWNVD